MTKQDIIKAIEGSNISAQYKDEIIAVIKKSNIPTSEQKEIIQTIKTAGLAVFVRFSGFRGVAGVF